MDRRRAPSLLPILRSERQAEIIALLLGDPELGLSLTELGARAATPHASVLRDVERAEAAGIVMSRRIENTRLVRADPESPSYAALAEVLTRASCVPDVVTP